MQEIRRYTTQDAASLIAPATWKAVDVFRLLPALAASLLLAGATSAAVSASASEGRCPSTDATAPCLTLTPNHGTTGTRVVISGRIDHRRDVWANAFQKPVLYASLIREVSGPDGASEIDNE